MKQNMRQNRNMLQKNERNISNKKGVMQYDGSTIQEEFIVSDAIVGSNRSNGLNSSSGNSSEVKNYSNYPQKTYRAGGIKATVWNNSVSNGNGTFTTVSLERVYQDKEGAWKSTNNLRLNDLPKVATIMNRAYADLIMKEQDLFKAEVS